MATVGSGLAVVVLLLNLVVSVGLGRLETLTGSQKTAWLLLVWLIPIVGAALTIQILLEARAIKATVREPGPDFGMGYGDTHHDSDFGGHGHGDGGGGGGDS